MHNQFLKSEGVIKMNQDQDMVLNCWDCKVDFTFSAGEQDFYKKNSLSEPKRCKDCRAAKRAKQDRYY